MTDLVTLAQAQAFLQDSSSASEAWIQACVDAAGAAVAEVIGVDPSSQVRTDVLSGKNDAQLFPNISPKSAPLTGITSISINPALTVGGGCFPGIALNLLAPLTVDLTTVAFDTGKIYYTNGMYFPRGKNNITVVYTAGYALTPTSGIPNLPSAITQAVLYTVAAFYNAKGKELNATGESYSGVMSQSFGPDGAGAVPPAARILLNPYRQLMRMPT